MKFSYPRLSTFAAATLCGYAASAGSDPAPEPVSRIVSVDIAALKNATPQVLRSAPFMKIVDKAGAKSTDHSIYVSEDQRFQVGVASHEEITLELTDWPIDEFMYFLEGRVEISDAQGVSRVYGPGDAILMPKGFTGIWRQLAAVKKISVVYYAAE